MHSPVIEPLNTPCVDQEITLFLEKIKKPVTNCDIILKSKVIENSELETRLENKSSIYKPDNI